MRIMSLALALALVAAGPAVASQPTAAAKPPVTKAAAKKAPKVVYVCPMHPEVTSKDPKARCPKCKMFLEPKK